MKKYNIIVVFDKTEKRILMCKRAKNPFKGKFNFVGGKVEQGETEDAAAYRELYEETGISKEDIILTRLMDFKYYTNDLELEVYSGKLNKDVTLVEEINKLSWIDRTENFCDMERFAGKSNIEHILQIVESYKEVTLK
ncbi:NUDIX hydrolase domain-like protein [Neocallimastix lanati (nom. inval.)]|uniref:8-oxo-dGTP diphosphatase n=1 Tax=Neocallimastix californiae TaxID=1754190 RepID=A0A1Y2DKZ4_9FUNG|nr:NUDIX hydrolase domain-like protein [Neocallimastix sp. JGI-2020a]ORY59839.1 hypothetical protein LY90DRAFT_668805 [Neocallimastix californiae]|eukprot:ORY59839.1 hypothetical protein LY90DRAFT_668805 [Neocallimastix californiae]